MCCHKSVASCLRAKVFLNPCSCRLTPELDVSRWTGENDYFYRGDENCFVVGSGSGGRAALWIDADLNLGRTQSCPTFDNEPLVQTEDFLVKSLECWAFVM
jgi:hypothetical protein